MKPRTTDPRHVPFTQAFSDAFLARFQIKYVHMGPIDGSALKRFLIAAPDVELPEWVRACNAAWNSDNMWLRQNAVTIAMICSYWNRISTLPSMMPAAPQPGGWR